jgi:hypothetical protein
MNANNRGFLVLAVATFGVLIGNSVFAQTNLDARSNTKVQGAMAKKWSGQAQTTAINPAQQNKQIVNYGSKKDNTCNLNVGTVQQQKGTPKYGQRQPKEMVVTTKDVINICK